MKLSLAWSIAFERLVHEARTDRAQLRDTGEWVVDFMGDGQPTKIIAMLPGEWTLIGARDDEDLTSTVFECSAERAVAKFLDHFQAGLYGWVAVFPDLRRFERGRLEALQCGTRPFEYEEWR